LAHLCTKLINFGSYILKYLQNFKKGLQAPKILQANVQKQNSFGESNFDNDFDFLDIGKLWSTYFDVFGKPSERATRHPNIVSQSSKQRNLVGDQILNFGPDFLKTNKIWFKCFGLIGKRSKSITRRPKFLDQSTKTKKFWAVKF